ncbi:hypothetical protein [Kitasatospora sp. A2-31]|uniref:hypothetical protein n=1 Tax=Kitasatospora sp. A2-31 TaxID=2916414 RepID=UPI0027E28657|nr:hypothetical protein [Kitasatospora sp. A2-31]
MANDPQNSPQSGPTSSHLMVVAGGTGKTGRRVAERLADRGRAVLDGRDASLSDGVRRARGREPRDFTTSARAAAARSAWNA